MGEAADGEKSKEPYLRSWQPPASSVDSDALADPRDGTVREAEIRDDLGFTQTDETASDEPAIKPGPSWPTTEEYDHGKAGAREIVDRIHDTTPQTGPIDQPKNDQPDA